MIHKIVVASAYIPVNFEKQVRSLQKAHVFLGNRIADDGKASIQLV